MPADEGRLGLGREDLVDAPIASNGNEEEVAEEEVGGGGGGRREEQEEKGGGGGGGGGRGLGMTGQAAVAEGGCGTDGRAPQFPGDHKSRVDSNPVQRTIEVSGQR